MQIKKISNDNLDEEKLKTKFAGALVFFKRQCLIKFELNEKEKSELSEYLKWKKNYEHKKSHLLFFQLYQGIIY